MDLTGLATGGRRGRGEIGVNLPPLLAQCLLSTTHGALSTLGSPGDPTFRAAPFQGDACRAKARRYSNLGHRRTPASNGFVRKGDWLRFGFAGLLNGFVMGSFGFVF